MIKSHQTKVTSGDKKHFAECKHVTETKITSQDPLIYFFSFVSLLFFFVVIVVMTILFDRTFKVLLLCYA